MRTGVLLLVLVLSACDATTPLAPSTEPASSLDPAAVSVYDPRAARARATIRVLCFGDSFTFGTTHRAAPGFATLSFIEGFESKLERLLRGASDDRFTLINSGIGGETTSAGLERLPAELRIHDPDLVLLWLGVVDINTNEKARFTLLRENLVEMMHTIKSQGAQVVIGTYPPMNPDGFRALAPENVPRLNDIIRQEANAQQVPIAGHERAFGSDLTLIGPDGLHPNDNGYQVIAETWFDVIKDLRLP
jgi:lysophospholipase L1-like esterase